MCVKQFPYQVLLIIYSGSTTYLFGGTIVNYSIVVTAAHCVTNLNASAGGPVFMSGLNVTVIAGEIDFSTTSSTMQTRSVCRLASNCEAVDTHMHNAGLYRYRLPIFVGAGEQRAGARELQLEHTAKRCGPPVLRDALHFSSAACVIPLPAQGTAFAGGLNCTVSGWGRTSSGMLSELALLRAHQL